MPIVREAETVETERVVPLDKCTDRASTGEPQPSLRCMQHAREGVTYEIHES
jgi:hypothetical protein